MRKYYVEIKSILAQKDSFLYVILNKVEKFRTVRWQYCLGHLQPLA